MSVNDLRAKRNAHGHPACISAPHPERGALSSGAIRSNAPKPGVPSVGALVPGRGHRREFLREARCIAWHTDTGRRCPARALRRPLGCLCREHSRRGSFLFFVASMMPEEARDRLAFGPWETAKQGEAYR